MDLAIIEVNKSIYQQIESGNITTNEAYGSLDEVKLNDEVTKIGKTTHESSGNIASLNASIRVLRKYKNKKEFITMKNQIMVNGMLTEKGDSGSLVTKNNNAVGVLFARDEKYQKAFFTPIHKIFNTEEGSKIGGLPPYHFRGFLQENII